MNKKIIVLLVIVAVAILGLLVFFDTNLSDDSNKLTLNVSSEGPYPLDDIVDDIKTNEQYKGYNNETLKWMESLGEKYVFMSSKEIVIMSTEDADKIPTVLATDVEIREIISCHLIEKHSLGSAGKDVLLVDDVNHIKEEKIYFDV